jgi:hypothetical protein
MIDLRAHPEYWERLSGLPAALRSLVLDGEISAYCTWLRPQMPTEEACTNHAKYVLSVANEIKANGYDAKRWRSDPRNFGGPEVDGFGPITVLVLSDDRVWPWDGAHRSCILLHLGLPVEAHEYRP